jgi:hypothetical protein
MFTDKDLRQIKQRGINFPEIESQVEYFRRGFPSIPLIKPATANDGIIKFNEEQINYYATSYSELINGKVIIKFVPSSGAATRMFKNLQSFRLKNLEPEYQRFELDKDKSFDSAHNFIFNLTKFAFYEDLCNVTGRWNIEIEDLIEDHSFNEIIDFLLTEKGLNYANLPKALLVFHNYPNNQRTSLEEHLVEAAAYACFDHSANLHFTVSPEHLPKFRALLDKMLSIYEKELKVKFNIGFSIQEPSTDTLGVDMNNDPFREKDGSLLFRPGGHGALLDNLNKLDADVVFIKNIDNVVPDRLKPQTILFKKVLGACLLELQSDIFRYIEMMESDPEDKKLVKEIESFVIRKLMFIPPENLPEKDKPAYFYKILNRPIRICGMVKNEGEPGGGPFWVKNRDGSASLQIVESSQIDHNEQNQVLILNSSTHFNPVDLVCGIKDYKGRKIDLFKFRDPETGFISIKSKDGKELKAMELPGLWNGAMADWNTVFVEVPLSTFNPVKTINDLLRPQHLEE